MTRLYLAELKYEEVISVTLYWHVVPESCCVISLCLVKSLVLLSHTA